MAVVDEKVKKLRFIIGKAEGRGKFFSRFFGERAPAFDNVIKKSGIGKTGPAGKITGRTIGVRLLERLITVVQIKPEVVVGVDVCRFVVRYRFHARRSLLKTVSDGP